MEEEIIILSDEEYQNLLDNLGNDMLLELAYHLKLYANRYKALDNSKDIYSYKFVYNKKTLFII